MIQLIPQALLAQDAQGGSALSFLIFLVPIGLLFFLMRSQRKRMAQQQAVQQGVEIGDEVLTSAGIFGTVVEIEDDDTIWVEIAPGTRVHMVRGGVARRLVDDDGTNGDDDQEEEEEEEATGAP